MFRNHETSFRCGGTREQRHPKNGWVVTRTAIGGMRRSIAATGRSRRADLTLFNRRADLTLFNRRSVTFRSDPHAHGDVIAMGSPAGRAAFLWHDVPPAPVGPPLGTGQRPSPPLCEG